MTAGTRPSLAILCGGRSSRFGEDKGLYAQSAADLPMVWRQAAVLAPGFAGIDVVVKDPGQARLYEMSLSRWRASLPEGVPIRVVTEDAKWPHAALAGVATALRAATASHVVVVAVDQVALRGAHLRAFRARAAADGTRAAAFALGDEVAPFPSLWPRDAAERVEARLLAGAFGVRDALRALAADAVPPGDYADEILANANRREDADRHWGEPLTDPFRRRLRYVRFSLTEACNLSCTYCLPDGFPDWYRHKARLKGKDIGVVLAAFRRMGFQKVRFTGGEPTVHPECLAAVATARRLGFEEVCMTTNGVLPGAMAEWAAAGLTQVNVSLDTLDAATFKALTKSSAFARVMDTIEAAIAEGLTVKVNTVLMRSRNAHEAESLMRWARGKPLTLRFIELMPTGLNQGFDNEERVLNTTLHATAAALGFAPAAQAGAGRAPGPAKEWRHPTEPGRLGFISPLSCNFCGDCNRLRVTARGELKMCLFSQEDAVMPMGDPEACAAFVRAAVAGKPEKHHLEERRWGNVATFRTIGG